MDALTIVVLSMMGGVLLASWISTEIERARGARRLRRLREGTRR